MSGSVVDLLYQQARELLDARLSKPRPRNISFAFGYDHTWETIRAVSDRLGQHYRSLGYQHRLETNAVHANIKARIWLTKKLPY